jgi:Kef-type K+ transport system membrane component KefB
VSENALLVELGILIFELGILISFSLFVAYLMKKFGIPAVLGLIVGGLILGLLTELDAIAFSSDFSGIKIFITEFALAWIGFDIGNEIDFNLLKEKGKDFGLILIGEAFGAYILVFLGIIILTGNLTIALILAAIGMATAPASTSQILGEYKAKGELSQTILFVLAFDDLLAILLFNMALAFLSVPNTGGIELLLFMSAGFIEQILITVTLGLGGALLIGFLRNLNVIDDNKSFEWLIGIGISIIGLTLIFGGSVILTMFIFGVATKYEVSKRLLRKDHILQAESMMIPIVTLFFILIGLEMDFGLLRDEVLNFINNFDLNLFSSSVLIITMIYFVSRAFGKGIGTIIAGKLSNLPSKVKSNLPISFITQAGVAIGLAGLAFNQLTSLGFESEANAILIVVTLSVIIAEIIGPLLVKKAIFRAGEVNLADNKFEGY